MNFETETSFSKLSISKNSIKDVCLVVNKNTILFFWINFCDICIFKNLYFVVIYFFTLNKYPFSFLILCL